MLSRQDNRKNQSKTVKFEMSDRVLSRTDKQRHVSPCPKFGPKNAMSRHETTWRGTNRHEAGQRANNFIFDWIFASGSNTITDNAGELHTRFSRSVGSRLDRILVKPSQVYCLTGENRHPYGA
jgi:hypothetical protein